MWRQALCITGEYRMKWYGEDEETAKANVPAQNQVME